MLHSLCKLSKLIAARVGLCGPCLGVGNQVAVFKQFALLAKDRIGYFAEPYHQEFWVASFAAEIVNICLVMLMHASIASCIILVVCDLVLYLCCGSSLSSSCKM
jgi:hypothetical protein